MLTHLTDFSDKLSPMLVKELRQGMRARSFMMLFLIFQGLLAFILLSAGAASGADNAGSFASGIIFTLFAGAALMIQPMRGVNALSSEITGNTIEMMVLTRLSAWRIVFGKWIAIVSQTALILITIIPYLILRYFFGGMILIGEMVFLTLMFLTSMALTAVMVGLSANSTKIVRVLPILGFVMLLQAVPMFMFRGGGFTNFMSFCSLSDWESRIAIASYLCFIAYFGWCALSHGTSVIAPVAENHSTIRRLVALGLVILTVAIGFHDAVDPRILPVVLGIILAPAIITAVTEKSILLPPVAKPFRQRGWPGRMAAIFLLPGWPAGVFFTALALSIALGGTVIAAGLQPTRALNDEMFVVILAVAGGLLLPALLASNFTKEESKRFGVFIIFLLASVILTILPAIFASINNHEQLLWLFVWNPPVILAMVGNSDFRDDHLLNAIIVVDSILLLLLLATATRAYRGYREIFAEADSRPSP